MHVLASITGDEIGDKIMGWVKIIYIILIVMVIGGLTLFNFTDWLRKTVDRAH
jgi:hypothetical protein